MVRRLVYALLFVKSVQKPTIFPLFWEILITMYRSLHPRVVSHLNVTQGYWAIKYAKNHFKAKEVNNPLKEKLSSFVDLWGRTSLNPFQIDLIFLLHQHFLSTASNACTRLAGKYLHVNFLLLKVLIVCKMESMAWFQWPNQPFKIEIQVS